MRIISYNINGIRAAIRKGFLDWLKTHPADVVCLQEVKAHLSDIDVNAIEACGYKGHWFCAEKKGYSGVGILTLQPPAQVITGCNMPQSDMEGRVIRADLGDITIINAYFPSGTTGEERQQYKYEWLEDFLQYLTALKKERPNLIVCGDYNIAHKPIDLHNPVSNKKSSGFLPEEREWFDRFLASGFADGFREINKEPHQYTWWHQLRPSTRLENKGWRIDYINVSLLLAPKITDARIFPDVKHSDHCPVYLQLNLT